MDHESSATPGSPRLSTERPITSPPPRPILRTHSPARSSVSSMPQSSPRLYARDYARAGGGFSFTPFDASERMQSPVRKTTRFEERSSSHAEKEERVPTQSTARRSTQRRASTLAVRMGLQVETPSKDERKPTAKEGLRDLLTHSPFVPFVLFVPVSWIVEFTLPHHKPSHEAVIFITSFFAIISLATFRAWAVGEITQRVGPTLETLIATTSGNVVPFIVGIVALTQCNLTAVHNSLIGSILTNLLFILGICCISAGRWKWKEQDITFIDWPVRMSASLVFLSVIAVMIPGVFHLIANSKWVDTVLQLRSGVAVQRALLSPKESLSNDLSLSRGVAVILLLIYIGHLIYQFLSHAHLYDECEKLRLAEEKKKQNEDGSKSKTKPTPTKPPPSPRRNAKMGSSIGEAITAPADFFYPHIVGGLRPFPHTPSPRREAPEVPQIVTSLTSSPKAVTRDLGMVASPVDEDEKPDGQEPTSSPHPEDWDRYSTADQRRRVVFADAGDVTDGKVVDVEKGIPQTAVEEETVRQRKAPLWLALLVLAVVTGIVANNVRFLINSMNGLSTFTNGSLQHGWVALIIIPLAGNVVDHFLTVQHASRGSIETCISLSFAASIQMALFAIPFLCLLAWMMGKPLTMVFDPFQTVVLFMATITVLFAVDDGKSNWLEGLILFSTYVIIATVFWFYPDRAFLTVACS